MDGIIQAAALGCIGPTTITIYIKYHIRYILSMIRRLIRLRSGQDQNEIIQKSDYDQTKIRYREHQASILIMSLAAKMTLIHYRIKVIILVCTRVHNVCTNYFFEVKKLNL